MQPCTVGLDPRQLVSDLARGMTGMSDRSAMVAPRQAQGCDSVKLGVAIAYKLQVVYVKFVGTHKEYDAVDAETVEMD